MSRVSRALAAPVLVLLSGGITAAFVGGQERPGYDDTPMLPDQQYRVHDKNRPHPHVVRPADQIGQPPADAVVLFDGSDLSAWRGQSGDAGWKLVDGAMEVNGSGKISTRQEFGDMQLHVEWASPAEVKGDSQGRGNSGVFLMDRYEIQVLDNYENATYPDGQAASIYGQYPPMVNACRGPGEWQSYDIFFRAPVFEEERLVSPAVVSVVHNGVLVHHAQPYIGGTAHKTVGTYRAHPATAPISLQDHGNPVRFRNIWVRPLKGYDLPEN